jgi:hypothetical protein
MHGEHHGGHHDHKKGGMHGEHHGGHSGMRSPQLPKEHFEHTQGELGHESKLKYASEMGNPHSLDKMTEGLANYAKKHQFKYE